jgi:hypothetical protein
MLRYNLSKYIIVDPGEHFGDLDIVLANEITAMNEEDDYA